MQIGGQIFHFNGCQDAESEAEPVAEGNAARNPATGGTCFAGREDKYSHRVGASATVALLADDGCAEMLWVGEGESVEGLRRTQTTPPQRENAKLNIGATELK